VDERPDQIEDHIRSTQRELGSNLQELENKVKDATNWRVQFERHPVAFLGIAFAGGLLLSAGLGGRRRHPPTYDRTWVPAAAYMNGAGPLNPANDPGFERKEKPSHVWNDIKGALLAAAGTQVSSVLGEFMPGFKEHTAGGSSPGPQPTAPANGNGVHEEVRRTNGPI
jgi:hypothetical protein